MPDNFENHRSWWCPPNILCMELLLQFHTFFVTHKKTKYTTYLVFLKMQSAGIEPAFPESESSVLSIILRLHPL